MHCTKTITSDLIWVGTNDRRLAIFEGVFPVPDGVSYNSFVLNDEKTVLFDTADKAVRQRFMENVEFALGGRTLDYLIIRHMEPDHSAAIEDVVARYPDVKIVCTAKTVVYIKQFFDFDFDLEKNTIVVGENDTLNTGKHTFHFIMAPMVHWPEVMVAYDTTDKILFSADAFGTFGALNGAIFADEVDFEKDYLDEFRRYYTNIVGKYGPAVQSLLKKLEKFDIQMICPLHGYLFRKDLPLILGKYTLWAAYQPEERGVMIAFASIYGNTENAADILACRLRDNGIKTAIYDVSVVSSSEIISAAFRWSHFVFASATYNGGIFVSMDNLLNELVEHNIQNRTVAVIENSTWATGCASLIRQKFEKSKKMTFLEQTVSVKSGLKEAHLQDIQAMVQALTDSCGKVSKPHNQGAVQEEKTLVSQL